MLPWFFLGILCAGTLGLQQMLLRRHGLWRRLLHGLISLSLFALLIPVVFAWRHTKEVPAQEGRLGLVLWDNSASCADLQQEKKAFAERLQSESGVEWFDFSEGLCAPAGKSEAGAGTDLILTLEQVAQQVQRISPDWLWLVTDGGSESPLVLPDTLKTLPLYLSPWNEVVAMPDIALEALHTDPVWYSRSNAPITINITRSGLDAANSVDCLVKMDGRLVSTVRATFPKGELRTQVETQLKAEHLGRVVIEVSIAEGQGGSRSENDHILHSNEVLRDRVRILRVVGRPNWSSKFLRDQLVQREDVDLVDFHILRSIRDRVMASTEELALIPFPVDELFVDNIDSFDLIIWQNFDHENYPFFKSEFIRNIAKAVESGCGLLLWNGSLPWNFQEGPMSMLAPIANRGDRQTLVEGLWATQAEEFLDPILGKALRSLGPSSLPIFKGQLHSEARVVLSLDQTPVIALREVGRGRVLQICSEELWQWAFHPPQELEGIYGEMVNKSLMWLQHHPELERHEFIFPQVARSGSKIEGQLYQALEKPSQLIWSNSAGETLERSEIPAGVLKFTVTAPKSKGLMQVKLEGGHPQNIALQGLQGEFLSSDVREQKIKDLQALGFKSIDLKAELPTLLPRSALVRSNGEPWHANWLYLGVFVFLLTCHWLILNRMLELQ